MLLTLLVLIIYLVILTFVTRFVLMLFRQVEKQVHGLRLPQSLLLGWIYWGSEFNIALRICLGIPLIPPSSSLICPCTQCIDQYGDHLLGCSCGPYRIRRHDALRDIIYHTLKLDNQNVKIEQRVNGDSNTSPGDPDFDNGKPPFLIFLSQMYGTLAQYLLLLMLVQSLRVEKLQKTINIVQ